MSYVELPENIEFTPAPTETHESFARFLRERVGLTHITAEDTNAFLKFHPLWQRSKERADERAAATQAAAEAREKEAAARAEAKAAKAAEAEQKRQEREAKKTERAAKKAEKDAAAAGDDSDLDAVDNEPDDEATPQPRKRRRASTESEPAF